MKSKLSSYNSLHAIFILALAVRLSFIFIGAKSYYGDNIHVNGDSRSYTDSFKNLVEEGHYTFDFNNPDASFGRLPGYPIFWGISYVIVGEEYANLSSSILQAIVDSLSAILIVLISRKIFIDQSNGVIAGLLYAVYPFSIVWTPIIGTETLGIFITLIFFFWIYSHDLSKFNNQVIGGILCAIAFYIRPYLGILIVAGILHILLEMKISKKGFISAFVFCCTFVILYSFWPIRNYFNHDRIILLKPTSAGYERYSSDVSAARAWIYCWSHDADLYLDAIANNQSVNIPKKVLESEEQKKQFQDIKELAYECGSGFYNWRTYKRFQGENCNEVISNGFDTLRKEFINSNFATFLFKVPILNISKFFFKNQLSSESSNNILIWLLFAGRSLLLVLAIIGIVLSFKKNHLAIHFFIVFMLLFISFYVRQMEMRYMLQAEILLLFYSVFAIGRGWQLISNKKFNLSE